MSDDGPILQDIIKLVTKRLVRSIIAVQPISPPPWILENNIWNDQGIWEDSETWND